MRTSRPHRKPISSNVSIVWFRLDLRLADNPALQAAIRRGGPVVPVFIHAPEEESPWEPGGASRWWLHTSFEALAADVRAAGSRLIIRRGPSLAALRRLVKDLLISWREGARWFWETLVDADLAQNTLGWQWTAGCGADAAPYFRVFNPTLQGETFNLTLFPAVS